MSDSSDLEVSGGSEPLKRDALGRLLPGQRSLNPSGAPARKPLTRALQRAFDELGDEGVLQLLQAQIAQVASGARGSDRVLEQLWDRLEGKVVQRVESTGDMRTQLVLEAGGPGAQAPALPLGIMSSEEVQQLEGRKLEGEGEDA